MQLKNIKLIIALLTGGTMLFSCTKVDRSDDFPAGDIPPIAGGFTSSDQIAPTNLLAYWSFDGNNNETKSNTAPLKAVNNSSTTGVKGQGLQLNGGYLVYPTINALSTPNAIASCSVSLWVKIANNGSTFSEFFTLARDTTVESDWLSVLNIGFETGQSTANTFLDLHSWIGSYPGGIRKGGDNINDYGNAGVDYQVVPKTSNWIHYVMRYDGAGENIDLFANNVRVSNNNFRHRTGLGPLICPTPTQVVLGAFSTATAGFSHAGVQGWQAPLTGSMDEVRVFNKALSDGEISALFQLGKQGR